MKNHVKIKVQREESLIGAAMPFNIKFNGEKKAKLWSGDSDSFSVEPGIYNVEVYSPAFFTTVGKSFKTPYLNAGDEFHIRLGVQVGVGSNAFKIYEPKHIKGEIKKIFLCYRREDSDDLTSRLNDHLGSVFGFETVLKDTNFIKAGEKFEAKIRRELAECAVMLVIIGKKWSTSNKSISQFVQKEIEIAIENDIPIIPILINGAQMPSKWELPSSIRELNAFQATELRKDPSFYSDIYAIINRLNEYI